MKKQYVIKILCMAVAIVFCNTASAQLDLSFAEETKLPQLYVDQSTNKSDVSQGLFEYFHSVIQEGVAKCHRVTPIDKTTIDVINANSVLEKLTSAGVDIVLQSTLLVVETQRVIPDKEKKSSSGLTGILNTVSTILGPSCPHYEAKVSFSLEAIDINSKRKVFSQTFTTSGTSTKEEESKDVAIQDAISEALSDVITMCKTICPLSGSIMKVEDTRKHGKRVETVIVDLGSLDGVSPKDKGKVYIKADIAGETAMTQIGELLVLEVLSDHRCKCKITKNKEEVTEAINNGSDVVVKL